MHHLGNMEKENNYFCQHTLQAIWAFVLMGKLVFYLEDLANPKDNADLAPKATKSFKTVKKQLPEPINFKKDKRCEVLSVTTFTDANTGLVQLPNLV